MAKAPRKIREPKAGSNGFDPAIVAKLVDRIEDLDDEKASEHGAYMKRCADINARRLAILDEAKARGVPTRPFKAYLKQRKLERKVEACRENLDDLVDREQFDLIRHAMGDLAELPLGEAALARVGMPGADNPGSYA